MRNPIQISRRKGDKIAAVNTKGRGTKAASTTKTTKTVKKKAQFDSRKKKQASRKRAKVEAEETRAMSAITACN
jgi:hypothetical protein